MRIVSRINVPAKFLQRLVNWLIRHQPPQGLLTARTGGELVFRNGRALSINHQRRVSNGPGRVIRVPPGHYEFERWYPLVCLLYAIYFPSEVPDGDLGVYRTPISKLFAEGNRTRNTEIGLSQNPHLEGASDVSRDR